MSVGTFQGEPIKTKAALVAGTETAFSEIRTERPEAPAESLAILDAGLNALRAIRDNPMVEDGNPKILMAMAELTFAVTAAAGLSLAIVVNGTKAPTGCQVH